MESTRGLNNIPASERGVTFGKPRPAAFGFQNGIQPDGVNDYLIGNTTWSGAEMPEFFAIEFWVKRSDISSNQRPLFWVLADDGMTSFQITFDNMNRIFVRSHTGASGSWVTSLDALTKHYCVLQHTPDNGFEFYQNGVRLGRVGAGFLFEGYTLSAFRLFSNNTASYFNNFIDEFRMYNRSLTLDEIRLSYNSGHGNNPVNLANLQAWYRFNEFNSGLITDFSGNDRHLTPVNMDTNPSSPNYVLKPF